VDGGVARARDNASKLLKTAREEIGLELGLLNRLGLGTVDTTADRTRLGSPPRQQTSFSSGAVESVPAPPPSPPSIVKKEEVKRRGPHDAALF